MSTSLAFVQLRILKKITVKNTYIVAFELNLQFKCKFNYWSEHLLITN